MTRADWSQINLHGNIKSQIRKAQEQSQGRDDWWIFADCVVPQGRVTVEVEVVKVETKIHGRMVHGITRRVMTIKAAGGWRAWGTCPAAFESVIKKGSRIRLSATFEPSKKTDLFGFFHRPHIVELLKE